MADRLVRDIDGNGLQEGQTVSTILGPAKVASFVHYPAFSSVRVVYDDGRSESLNGDDVRLHGEHPLAAQVEEVAPCGCVAYVDGTGEPCATHHPDGPTDQTEQKPKRYLDFRFDITDLSEDEVSRLWGEVVVQAESSDGHPSVEVEGEIVEHPVEDEAV